MMIRIYHNPRCSKSRQALAILEESGAEYEVVEYLKHPPSAAELDRLLRRLGLQPAELMRTGEAEYRELELADKRLSRKEAIQVLVAHPRLIERPIADDGQRAIVARPPERIRQLLD
jgi:arsenate reductase